MLSVVPPPGCFFCKSNPQNPNPILSLSSFSSPLLSFSTSFLSLSCSSFPSSHPHNNPLLPPNDDVEEHVIGDSLVFEDGVFEDPFLNEDSISSITLDFGSSRKPKLKKKSSEPEIEPENLVPEQWQKVVDEINLTKKERRKILREVEFGQKLERKKKVPVTSVRLEEYLWYRDEKLAQLKPVVLDNPIGYRSKTQGNRGDDDGVKSKREDLVSNGNSRVEPRNPRWAVYGRHLDDITEFFNSGSYQPGDNKAEGRQTLFTKEEKVLMNAKRPNLAVATSRKWLPLHALAASGEFYLVNSLLKYDVDINGADQDGLTALHRAITCKKQAVTNYLLRESANPFVRDKDGATLMHYAVRTASSQAIKTLLLYNVDINLQDNDGWTPLHLAVQAQRTGVVRLLLIKGADKSLRNQFYSLPPPCPVFGGGL